MIEGRRRQGGLLLLLFLALTLIVINASNWFVLSRVTASVDEELGLRLETVASAAVTTATPELLLAPEVSEDLFVARVLREIAEANELEDVFLADPQGVVLFDLGREAGEPNPFLALEAFGAAGAGRAASSPSLTVDGTVLKAAFAPVRDWDGTVEAVLGVTAGGGFFSSIPALRRTLLAVSLGSAALVAVLGLVFFGMSRRLARTESALSRAETLSAMGTLAAGVAHEVRNPLAIIAGTASRLKKKYSGSGGDPLFDFIPEEVERLNGIVEGYLRFARDEPLAPVECDLRSVIERTARLVEQDLAARNVRLHRDVGSEPVPIRADPQRIQQVVLNLLLNAAQAMAEGGELGLELVPEREACTIRVSDEGPGFSRKQLKDAFQPFYTTKEKGSGLGLFLAKRIVEGHGGTIAVANRAGGGAIVTVELPRGSEH
jgi:signal transduction histidine kinase